MTVQIIHKNSSVSGKSVSSSQIAYGELAINYNENGPYLQVRASDDEVWSVGGVTVSSDAPGSPLEGAFWFNSDSNKLLIRADGAWHNVGTGGGGGGGAGAVDQIIGGNGITVDPTSGEGTVTINVDQGAGLEFDGSTLRVHLDGDANRVGLEFAGSNSDELRVRIASTTQVGSVKIDSDANRAGVEMSGDDLRAILASETQVGSIKVGEGLNITGGDTLNVDEGIINGMQFEGSVDLRAAKSNTNPAVNNTIKRGYTYIHENDAAGAMDASWQTATGESVNVSTGDLLIAQEDDPGDGEWTLITTSGTNFWNRDTSGDVYLEPATAGDDIFTSGDLRIGDAATTPHFLVDGSDGDVTSDGGAHFNVAQATGGDFRVDGENDANMLFVDASEDSVGIGTGTPQGTLEVVVGDNAPASSGDMDTGVIIEAASSSRALNLGVNNTGEFSWINAAFSNNSGVPDNLALMTGATERMRIASSGDVGIGTTELTSFNGTGADHRLIVAGSTSDTDIANNSGAAITISNTDGTADNTAGLHFAREDNDQDPHFTGASIVAQFTEAQVTGEYPRADLAFLTSTAANNAPSEKVRIDSAGRLLVGLSSAVTGLGGASANLQINEGQQVAAALLRSTDDTAGANLVFRKTRSAAPTGVDPVDDGDFLGNIFWLGTDGANALPAAQIDVIVDGTPGTNDMPGQLRFQTTAAGDSSPTERLRIRQDGTLQLLNSPGIDFSQIQANASGMSSETLDSYEEGTFKVEVADEAVGGNTATLSVNDANYTKIGRLITVNVSAQLSDVATLTGGNSIFVRGVPFAVMSQTADNNVDYMGATILGNVDVGADVYSAAVRTIPASGALTLVASTDAAGSANLLCSALTNTSSIQFSMSYYTS